MKSKTFGVTGGLRQGGVLSPVLLNIFMDKIMKECSRSVQKPVLSLKICKKVLMSECAFADDIPIIADSEDLLQNNLKIWNEELKKNDMKMNLNKTKVMATTEEEER